LYSNEVDGYLNAFLTNEPFDVGNEDVLKVRGMTAGSKIKLLEKYPHFTSEIIVQYKDFVDKRNALIHFLIVHNKEGYVFIYDGRSRNKKGYIINKKFLNDFLNLCEKFMNGFLLSENSPIIHNFDKPKIQELVNLLYEKRKESK
jgi:hypothetical protein